jgi:hypothetical protein
MKLFKFVGWVFLGLFLFSGLAYGFFPILASKVTTQILTDHGFENVKFVIDYPGFQAVSISNLSPDYQALW